MCDCYCILMSLKVALLTINMFTKTAFHTSAFNIPAVSHYTLSFPLHEYFCNRKPRSIGIIPPAELWGTENIPNFSLSSSSHCAIHLYMLLQRTFLQLPYRFYQHTEESPCSRVSLYQLWTGWVQILLISPGGWQVWIILRISCSRKSRRVDSFGEIRVKRHYKILFFEYIRQFSSN